MATPETAVYPDTQDQFEKQLSTLIPKLESSSDPEHPGDEDFTDEFIAEHFYADSKDIETPDQARIPGLSYTAEFTKQGNEVNLKKKGEFQPVFTGTSKDSWQSKSSGALVKRGSTGDYQFFALDGVKIPKLPFFKFMVIFWYSGLTKIAVFVGKSGQGDTRFTSGKGKFN